MVVGICVGNEVGWPPLTVTASSQQLSLLYQCRCGKGHSQRHGESYFFQRMLQNLKPAVAHTVTGSTVGCANRHDLRTLR